MTLIASLEDAVEIMMETDDFIEFASWKRGKETLKKYDIELQY